MDLRVDQAKWKTGWANSRTFHQEVSKLNYTEKIRIKRVEQNKSSTFILNKRWMQRGGQGH